MKPGDIIETTINVPIKIMMLPGSMEGFLCMTIQDAISNVSVDDINIGFVGASIGGHTYFSVDEGPTLAIPADGMWNALINFCLDNGLLEEGWVKKLLEKKRNEKIEENLEDVD